MKAAWAAAFGCGGGCCLLLRDQRLDVGVDAVQCRLVLGGESGGLVLGGLEAVPASDWAWDFCCSSDDWVAASCVWAVCRWSMVDVTLPVAIDEYSERMPLVFTFDVKSWVAVFDVPELV